MDSRSTWKLWREMVTRMDKGGPSEDEVDNIGGATYLSTLAGGEQRAS